MIGAGKGAGVTHLTVMTANYMTGVCRRKTAVLEWNHHGDFRRIEAICGSGMPGAVPFRVLEADYYACAGTAELLCCREAGYEEVLLDYGTVSEGGVSEFLRCDRRFVVGALSEWAAGAFLKLLDTAGTVYKGCGFLAAFGSEEARKEVNRKLRRPVERIPFSEDAFTVDRRVMYFFEHIF